MQHFFDAVLFESSKMAWSFPIWVGFINRILLAGQGCTVDPDPRRRSVRAGTLGMSG